MLKGPIKTSKQFIWWGKEIQEQTYLTCFTVYQNISVGFDEETVKRLEAKYFEREKQIKELNSGTLSI